MWWDQTEIVQRWLDDYLLINNKMKNKVYKYVGQINKIINIKKFILSLLVELKIIITRWQLLHNTTKI